MRAKYFSNVTSKMLFQDLLTPHPALSQIEFISAFLLFWRRWAKTG
jgi:hypothetical protein